MYSDNNLIASDTTSWSSYLRDSFAVPEVGHLNRSSSVICTAQCREALEIIIASTVYQVYRAMSDPFSHRLF